MHVVQCCRLPSKISGNTSLFELPLPETRFSKEREEEEQSGSNCKGQLAAENNARWTLSQAAHTRHAFDFLEVVILRFELFFVQ